ncbi:MAG TPA: hypothetical protein VEH10_00265 [Thermoplasmata archaeon]|nr:hypothetical protein [Thermoplasmata archaeon]
MSGPGGPSGLPELVAAARLTDEPALASEIVNRLPLPADPRPVSVTDLLAPRRAFWRRVRGPAPIALERELRLERGRAWHQQLGDAVASDGRLEVRVRRGGLSARIDLLADVPVEIKTAPAWSPGSTPADWPDQVEQLGVYCALVGRSNGRLVHLATPDDGPPTIDVGELRFRDLGAIDAEVERREAELRGALEEGTPDRLGRCRWFDNGCEYRAHGICACRGNEPDEPTSIVEQLERRVPRPEIAERWSEAVRARAAPGAAPPGRFRDLLYPRRAYFDRTTGRPPVAVPPRPPAAPLDIYERTIASLERGPVGDLHRLVAGPDGPEEEVLAWRGAPCLVRSSRTRSRLTVADLRTRFPQYVVELGFRCALTGVPTATLVIGHESVAPGEPLVQVFRLDLPEGTAPYSRVWTARRTAFEGALARAAPAELPSCPAWMVSDCPYREACGCADEVGRSQR